jgi:hypothetical protein
VKLVVVLDNEAVQALGDAAHPKHRRLIGLVQVVAHRKRRALDIALVVPTAVRVEAGWDRAEAAWASVNRLGVIDEVLGPGQANVAAQIRSATGVSVADAHLGAVVQASNADRVTVLTSDPGDAAAVAGGRPVNIIRI